MAWLASASSQNPRDSIAVDRAAPLRAIPDLPATLLLVTSGVTSSISDFDEAVGGIAAHFVR
jgi:hypothetical protein